MGQSHTPQFVLYNICAGRAPRCAGVSQYAVQLYALRYRYWIAIYVTHSVVGTLYCILTTVSEFILYRTVSDESSNGI